MQPILDMNLKIYVRKNIYKKAQNMQLYILFCTEKKDNTCIHCELPSKW